MEPLLCSVGAFHSRYGVIVIRFLARLLNIFGGRRENKTSLRRERFPHIFFLF
jgi:hypothetical protein